MPDGRAIVTGSPVRAGGFASDALPFDLRLLINVAGPQGRIFVRRWMLDVAMHADGAAVHDAANAGAGRGVDQIADRGGVHGAVRRLRNAGLPVDGGDVVDDVDILHRARERGAILERADDRLDARRFELASLRALPRRDRERDSRAGRAFARDDHR